MTCGDPPPAIFGSTDNITTTFPPTHQLCMPPLTNESRSLCTECRQETRIKEMQRLQFNLSSSVNTSRCKPHPMTRCVRGCVVKIITTYENQWTTIKRNTIIINRMKPNHKINVRSQWQKNTNIRKVSEYNVYQFMLACLFLLVSTEHKVSGEPEKLLQSTYRERRRNESQNLELS